MFIGSINQDVKAVLSELAPAWRKKPVYVGCSGNFTVERILAQAGIDEVHSNDVSLYSCALGGYLTGKPIALDIADDRYEWLRPYIEPGLPAIATLMLCTELLKYADRQEAYHRRMFQAYKTRFAGLHEQTVEKITKALEYMAAEYLAGQ